jgi:hypothetical protein
MESNKPLVRKGVSSFKFLGDSPGKNSDKMYARISSLMLSVAFINLPSTPSPAFGVEFFVPVVGDRITAKHDDAAEWFFLLPS